MDRAQLEAMIAELDRAIPKEGAHAAINQYGGEPDQCAVIANQSGYLRLGVELLKAAYAPAGAGGSPVGIPVDIQYLLGENSQIQLDWFERRDPEAQPVQGSCGLSGLMALVICFGMLAVFLVGCYTIASYVVALF